MRGRAAIGARFRARMRGVRHHSLFMGRGPRSVLAADGGGLVRVAWRASERQKLRAGRAPMTARKALSKSERREQAVRKVARDHLHMDIGMQHADSEHVIKVADLRRALTDAYDAGVRSAMS